MKSEWEAGINALESRYFGWWSGSSGCESDGSGGGDSIFFRGTVFVCDRGGVLEGTFWVGGT